MNTKEIIEHLKIEINHDAKNLCSKLSMYILGKSAFDDLKNDGYVIKSVRLNSSLTPKEAISFPAFQYEKIVKEDWQKSDLFFHLSKRYLFVFYSQNHIFEMYENDYSYHIHNRFCAYQKSIKNLTFKLLNSTTRVVTANSTGAPMFPSRETVAPLTSKVAKVSSTLP